VEFLSHQAFSKIRGKDRRESAGSVRERVWIDVINKAHNWHIRNTIDAFHAIGVFNARSGRFLKLGIDLKRIQLSLIPALAGIRFSQSR